MSTGGGDGVCVCVCVRPGHVGALAQNEMKFSC